MEANGAVDAQNAPTAPWKTLCVFHELPQGLSHQVTHEKLRKAPKYRWETRIDPEIVTLLLEAGAATDLRNNDGVTPLEAVSGPWSEELRGLYEFFDGIFQMQLDIDRIREVRPEVHAILQAAG